MQITTIGLDIAKNVFQVHGIDAAEKVVVRKQLRRKQLMPFFEGLAPCLVGMEACATSHHWARELTRLGHRVRLMPAKDVKAYVKCNKNDAARHQHHTRRQKGFVALWPANRVAAVDGVTHEVIKYLLVGQRVWHMAFTPDEKYLLTTNGVSNDVRVRRQEHAPSLPIHLLPVVMRLDDFK